MEQSDIIYKQQVEVYLNELKVALVGIEKDIHYLGVKVELHNKQILLQKQSKELNLKQQERYNKILKGLNDISH